MSTLSPKRIQSSEKYPDWQNLPIELTEAIANRVTSIGDYVSFRGVSRSWRFAATFANFDREFPRVPWLLYAAEEERGEKTVVGDDVADEGREEKTILGDDFAEKTEEKTVLGENRGGKAILGDVVRQFTSFVTNCLDRQRNEVRKVTNIREPKRENNTLEQKRKNNILEQKRENVKKVTKFFDPQSKTNKIINFPPPAKNPYLSWSGWILCNGFVDVKLTHFIWRIQINLPGLNTFPGGFSVIRKMVLSDSPTIKSDLVVMVIWGGRNQLGFCRPGDASWTATDHWEGSFCDIVYSNKKLYAVDSSLRIVQCDVHGNNPTQLLQVFVLGGIDHNLQSRRVTHYLVESSGKLLIACQYFIQRKTMEFRVFEIDLMDGSHKEIHELGNRALFLGCNASICVELPAWSKVKPDRIYFTDNTGPFNFSDAGVYKLANRSIKGFFAGSGLISPPPTWVLPSF